MRVEAVSRSKRSNSTKGRSPLIRKVSTILMLAFLLSSVIAASAQRQEQPGKRREVVVRAMTLPTVPVTFSHSVATRVSDRTVMSYTATNNAGVPISSIHVVVFVVDASGRIKAGEGWRINLDLAPNSTQDLQDIIESKVGPGDHVILSALKASGGGTEFEADASDLLNSVKGRSASINTPSLNRRFVRVALQTVSFCEAALNLAKRACSDEGGLSSFSCDEKNQTFSFTCKGRAPVLE